MDKTYTVSQITQAIAGEIVVDSGLSTTSTNPVQNKVITTALKSKQDKLIAGDHITIEGNVISSTGGGGGTSDLVLGEDPGTAYEGSKGKANAEAIHNLNNNKFGVSRYPLGQSEVQQADATLIINSFAAYMDKIIEFKSAEKIISYGLCMITNNGDKYLLEFNHDGRIRKWSSFNYSDLYDTSLQVDAKVQDAKDYTDTKVVGLETTAGSESNLRLAKQYAKDYTDTAISNIINGAPDTYDTFKEIAEYISKDQSGAEQMLASIQANAAAILLKADKTELTPINDNISDLQNSLKLTNESVAQHTTDISSIRTDINGLQPKLKPGKNITISPDNTISAENEVIIDEDKVNELIDAKNLQPKLTAGNHISIDSQNNISATDIPSIKYYETLPSTTGLIRGDIVLVPAEAIDQLLTKEY